MFTLLVPKSDPTESGTQIDPVFPGMTTLLGTFSLLAAPWTWPQSSQPLWLPEKPIPHIPYSKATTWFMYSSPSSRKGFLRAPFPGCRAGAAAWISGMLLPDQLCQHLPRDHQILLGKRSNGVKKINQPQVDEAACCVVAEHSLFPPHNSSFSCTFRESLCPGESLPGVQDAGKGELPNPVGTFLLLVPSQHA